LQQEILHVLRRGTDEPHRRAELRGLDTELARPVPDLMWLVQADSLSVGRTTCASRPTQLSVYSCTTEADSLYRLLDGRRRAARRSFVTQFVGLSGRYPLAVLGSIPA